jgi:hypothetical protein
MYNIDKKKVFFLGQIHRLERLFSSSKPTLKKSLYSLIFHENLHPQEKNLQKVQSSF